MLPKSGTFLTVVLRKVFMAMSVIQYDFKSHLISIRNVKLLLTNIICTYHLPKTQTSNSFYCKKRSQTNARKTFTNFLRYSKG